MPINTGFINNYPLKIPACIYTLTVLADLLYQEEDKDI